MKIQIRRSVFETNSSSVHNLILCTKEQWDKFISGELVADFYSEKLLSRDDPDVLKYQGDGFLTYEEYQELDYNIFNQSIKLPDNTEVVAFGYYGYED